MFRRTIPLAIAALVSTGSLAASAAGHSPRTADGPCPETEIEVDESAPPPSLPDSDDLEDRCDIVPEAYYLNYTSPEYEDMAPTALPSPATTMPGSGTVMVAEAAADQAIEPMPPLPPEPGPLDDNTFVDEGDSVWVETESDRESTFALDVDTGSFSVAQQFLTEGYLPEPDSIRPEEWINSFDYGDEPADDGEVLDITVDSTTDGPDGTALVRLGISTVDLDPIERPSANITFVIDTSGSMDIRERLGMVKASLALLVRNLRPDDTIAIVTYGDMATPVLAPTPVEEWRDIVDAIDALTPSGSTNMEAGLLLGYEQARESYDPDALNVVVLASDGVANQGVTDPEVLTDQITQSGEEGIHLVTVGYGMGNYNDYLMEQLADQGDGFYSYIDTFEEAERLFVDELTPTLHVVAEQAKVQVVFDSEVVERYRLIGYENRMLDDEQFSDDSVDAGELGAGHQVSALYEVELYHGGDVGDGEGAGETEIGSVRLRWQEPGTDDVTEIEQDIEIGDDDASDSVRMAALVAYTAELLKGNSVVADRDVTLDDLLDEAEELADEGVDGADVMVEFIEDALDAEPPYPVVIED